MHVVFKFYSILIIMCIITEKDAKHTPKDNSKNKGQTEAPQYMFDFSSVLEDASRVFGDVLGRMFAHKKLMGIETRVVS